MVRERIADDIYVFTSRRYAQVTAGAVLTPEGVVLIDTLFYPEESQAMKTFLEERLEQTVRYIINTHYHADHTQGTYLFPGATVISHALCRERLDTVGREGLARSQAQSTEFDDVSIVLPSVIFETGRLNLHFGGKTLRLTHQPGHSPDIVNVLVVENGILFASDNMMPVPTFFDGSYDALVTSLETLRTLSLETVVQGHGEAILRGELDTVLQGNLDYLTEVRRRVTAVFEADDPAALDDITIESCGKSRIPLNGFVTQLHKANVEALYHDLTASVTADPV